MVRGRVFPSSVDADGVQAASGKAAEPADTGFVPAGSANAAGRRLDAGPRRQMVGRPAPAATRTARSERDRILAALLAEVDELAERALVRMPEEIPAYRGRDEAFFADVHDQVCRHYRTKLAALDNRPVTREDLAFA